MTDNEIIKALECCVKIENPCKKCPLDGKCISDDDTNILHQYALDIINRLKAEIERLRDNLKCVLSERADYSEAIKEFAKRLKEQLKTELGNISYLIIAELIDNLVKELTEKNDFKE